ncbi:hypothetical protein BTUL_0057g00310 [Botrytis tulipae]|uniref:F-box domain-containing protein n=1 Tax=Botrytis tulipae TaxID=87230 RepID=A0A4Z1EPL2_9HELO|nr:hypothetical protein BTUL_0057g00310 [Botrytis tulipae]
MAMSIEGSKLRHDHEKAPIHSAGPLEKDGGSIHTDKKKSEGNTQAVDLSPDDTYEIAVQKHAYGGWFGGLEFIKDGKVYIIGADIQPFSEKCSCATTKFIHVVKDDGYTYIVAQPMTCSEHRLRMDIEDQIFPETKDMGQRLGIYPGENSWNLPRSHRYHILNFPPEILHIIFRYLLWIPYAFVEPDVVITNVVKSYEKFKKPTYKATLLNEILPMHNDDATYEPWRGSTMIKEKKICHGGREIIQLNRILRRMIDATCLRTCREFFRFGSAILYGNNIFKFPVETIGPYRNETCWIEGEFYNPDREKPKLGQLYDWPQAIPYVMEQIRQGVPLKELAGWAYHDLFLRFLYVIRPRNLDLIKHLYFWGTTSIHSCNSKFRDGRCPNCPVNLFPEMCIYIEFINELCPSVERVTLEIDASTLSDAYDSYFSLSKERDFEHTITPFLMNQIRELKYVKSLTLRSWDTGGLKYAYDNPDRIHGSQDLDFPIAKETIKWFDDRAKGWAKEEQ